ncbi:MAG: hypothetical protein JXA51_00510 [Dehalococcoidales bacterium]|nr:hypothetical protein [Dehalococcoidales bacterium]
MKNESKPRGVENWSTGRLILAVYGSLTIICILLLLTMSLRNVFLGYSVFSLYILLGLAMLIKTESIGTAMFEAGIRLLEWIWRWILMMREGKIQESLNKIESGFLGLNFYIGITFFIGLALIAMSIFTIVMIAKGSS